MDQDKRQQIAVFRFQVIGDLVGTRSFHPESKNDLSEKNAAENGICRSPPRRGSPAAQSSGG